MVFKWLRSRPDKDNANVTKNNIATSRSKNSKTNKKKNEKFVKFVSPDFSTALSNICEDRACLELIDTKSNSRYVSPAIEVILPPKPLKINKYPKSKTKHNAICIGLEFDEQKRVYNHFYRKLLNKQANIIAAKKMLSDQENAMSKNYTENSNLKSLDFSHGLVQNSTDDITGTHSQMINLLKQKLNSLQNQIHQLDTKYNTDNSKIFVNPNRQQNENEYQNQITNETYFDMKNLENQPVELCTLLENKKTKETLESLKPNENCKPYDQIIVKRVPLEAFGQQQVSHKTQVIQNNMTDKHNLEVIKNILKKEFELQNADFKSKNKMSVNSYSGYKELLSTSSDSTVLPRDFNSIRKTSISTQTRDYYNDTVNECFNKKQNTSDKENETVCISKSCFKADSKICECTSHNNCDKCFQSVKECQFNSNSAQIDALEYVHNHPDMYSREFGILGKKSNLPSNHMTVPQWTMNTGYRIQQGKNGMKSSFDLNPCTTQMGDESSSLNRTPFCCSNTLDDRWKCNYHQMHDNVCYIENCNYKNSQIPCTCKIQSMVKICDTHVPFNSIYTKLTSNLNQSGEPTINCGQFNSTAYVVPHLKQNKTTTANMLKNDQLQMGKTSDTNQYKESYTRHGGRSGDNFSISPDEEICINCELIGSSRSENGTQLHRPNQMERKCRQVPKECTILEPIAEENQRKTLKHKNTRSTVDCSAHFKQNNNPSIAEEAEVQNKNCLGTKKYASHCMAKSPNKESNNLDSSSQAAVHRKMYPPNTHQPPLKDKKNLLTDQSNFNYLCELEAQRKFNKEEQAIEELKIELEIQQLEIQSLKKACISCVSRIENSLKIEQSAANTVSIGKSKSQLRHRKLGSHMQPNPTWCCKQISKESTAKCMKQPHRSIQIKRSLLNINRQQTQNSIPKRNTYAYKENASFPYNSVTDCSLQSNFSSENDILSIVHGRNGFLSRKQEYHTSPLDNNLIYSKGNNLLNESANKIIAGSRVEQKWVSPEVNPGVSFKQTVLNQGRKHQNHSIRMSPSGFGINKGHYILNNSLIGLKNNDSCSSGESTDSYVLLSNSLHCWSKHLSDESIKLDKNPTRECSYSSSGRQSSHQDWENFPQLKYIEGDEGVYKPRNSYSHDSQRID